MTIAYDGTDFCGWQRQLGSAQRERAETARPAAGDRPFDDRVSGAERAPAADAPREERHAQGNEGDANGNGGEAPPADRLEPPSTATELRTVQGVVQAAVREVVREPVEVIGASRTDSGVHARGQVAAFTASDGADRGRGWPAERGTEPLLRAINSRLPEDVLARSIEVVSPRFDPIGDCVSKAYTYRLWVSPERPLWERRWVHHVWTRLDVERMREAAAEIVGEHDFAAFAAAGHGRLTTVRRVFECRVEATERPSAGATEGSVRNGGEPEQSIEIFVSGSGFLWHMVRIIAGTLYEVGRGRMDVAQVREALATGDRRKAGPTLPAKGLCLQWVRYDQ
jgi:tRNA pseudouridine38-40 synthase